MKSKLSTIAILVALSASYAFAGDKAKSTASSDDAQPAVTAAASANEQNPCVTNDHGKKGNPRGYQAPENQEQEFNRVLMGIYG